jgi:sigma-E factor negative regulatory protein RseB
LLILAVAPAYSDEVATRWLERMSQAAHKLNYIGTFVYMQDRKLETMRLLHAVDAEGERERLVSLSGPAREVIREYGQVTCYLPSKDALVARHPSAALNFPINLPTHWEQLSSVYDFKVVGQKRVAGHAATHIAIVPRDNYRYGQNYWIDNETGLLLRTDITDEKGSELEQLEFTSLEVVE